MEVARRIQDRLNIIIAIGLMGVGLFAGYLLDVHEVTGWLWYLSISVFMIALIFNLGVVIVLVWHGLYAIVVFLIGIIAAMIERKRVKDLNIVFEKTKRKKDE